MSTTNVARAGKLGNICVGNHVSATMCPRLPGPLMNPLYIHVCVYMHMWMMKTTWSLYMRGQSVSTRLLFVILVDGRLEKELEYTKKALGEGYGSTNELLIQTPNEEGTNILTVQALKRHLDILMKVTNVSVDLFDQ